MELISSIIWLRRDLRLYDHKVFYHALQETNFIQPIFIFDFNILKNFPNKHDKRLSFLADTLIVLNDQLQSRGGRLLILYGKPEEIITNLAKTLKVKKVFAGQDYEPFNITRDELVKAELAKINVDFVTINDHLLISPEEISKADKSPYKIFTPYSKIWKDSIKEEHYRSYDFNDTGCYLSLEELRFKLPPSSLLLDLSTHPQELLSKINYKYEAVSYWQPTQAREQLNSFIDHKIDQYEINRNFMAVNATSKLSPYIRFGIISIRECYRKAIESFNHVSWVNELIWRDFYAMILYKFPHSENENFQEKYKNKIIWQNNQNFINKFIEAKTGYPIIDAAIRELLTTGWMHNRARMIVASFFTKDLLSDWKIGEKFFAQYLMDYELSSNIGGWQWAASTGTDAQPYFRIFNPALQSKKFDPEGLYIKKYIPELNHIPTKYIHSPLNYNNKAYYKPIVEHKNAAATAIEFYRNIRD